MIIDHICFAVKDIAEGIDYWERVFGYRQMTKVIDNSLQKVKVTFLKKENSLMVKLIEPSAGNESLINFVKNGGGFHHICFLCSNLSDMTDELSKKGLITLAAPQPGEAFNNRNIAFMLAKNGLRIELIDTVEKAGIIDDSIMI